ncbi:hypothetical protein DFJ74DRAFT_723075 [Hyaloraphidium curvatum]|nr:hypothetical protein DFJ74DRAFT_723075 [Hyaloraphidium curvatum]
MSPRGAASFWLAAAAAALVALGLSLGVVAAPVNGSLSVTSFFSSLRRRQGPQMDWGRNYRVLQSIAAQASLDVYGADVYEHRHPEVAVYEDLRLGWQMLVFRGTDGFEDFTDNLLALGNNCDIGGPCGRVHWGYYREFQVRMGWLQSVLDFNSRMLVTGHSLGGGMAVLGGLYVQRRGAPEVHVVTFGQPSVTDETFRSVFNGAGITYDRFFTSCGPYIDWAGCGQQHTTLGIWTSYWDYCDGQHGGSGSENYASDHSSASTGACGGPPYSRTPSDDTPEMTCRAPTGGPSYPGSSWTCLQDEGGADMWVPVKRTEQGQVGCMSTNSWDCIWAPRSCCERVAASGDDTSPYFECGSLHYRIWGTSGYSDPNHWCYRGWQALNPGQPMPVVQC